MNDRGKLKMILLFDPSSGSSAIPTDVSYRTLSEEETLRLQNWVKGKGFLLEEGSQEERGAVEPGEDNK